MKTSQSIWILVLFLAATTAILSTCGSSPPPADAHWPDCETGQGNINNATAIVTFDAATAAGLYVGDIVGVFASGDCVGQALYTGGNFAVTVWGDDVITPERDGAFVGEELSLRLYTDRPVFTSTDVPLVYGDDAVYVVSDIRFDGPSRQAEVDSLQSVVDALRIQNDGLQLDLTAALERIQSAVDVLTQ